MAGGTHTTPGERGPTLKGRLRFAVHRVTLAAVGTVLRRRRAPRSAGRPRVTILLGNAYGIGGTTRTCLNLAGQLAATHDVEIISLVRERDDPVFAHPPGVTVTVVCDRRGGRRGVSDRLPSVLMLPIDHRMNRWASLRTDAALVRALWRVRAGVLIGTRPAFNVLVAALGRPGLATVGQEHINLDTHRSRMRAELLRCYARLDATVVLTEHDRSRWTAALGGRGHVVAIPNAVPRLAGPCSDLTQPTVVAVGRLVRQKGFDLLIPAFAQALRSEPGWTLRICGGGEMRAELDRLVGEHGVTRDVRLLGPVLDVERELTQASIFALSSRFEGLPMAMLEAMSKGLPVVAFDCPTGPAEVIEHGRQGLLVEPGDVAALGDALAELMRDEQRRVALGAAARRRAADFSMDSVGASWARLLTELRHRPAPT